MNKNTNHNKSDDMRKKDAPSNPSQGHKQNSGSKIGGGSCGSK